MFVLITYDVNITSPFGAKRLRQVARICKDYGVRVQNSVFECIVTDAQLTLIKNKISTIISNSHDSIRFYVLGNNWQRKVDVLGIDNGPDVTGELII
jgi:CRISPR-associated protein Cas2